MVSTHHDALYWSSPQVYGPRIESNFISSLKLYIRVARGSLVIEELVRTRTYPIYCRLSSNLMPQPEIRKEYIYYIKNKLKVIKSFHRNVSPNFPIAIKLVRINYQFNTANRCKLNSNETPNVFSRRLIDQGFFPFSSF